MPQSEFYCRTIAVSAHSDVILYRQKDAVVYVTTLSGRTPRQVVNCPDEWIKVAVSTDGKFAIVACPDARWISCHDLEHGQTLFTRKVRDTIRQVGFLEHEQTLPYAVFESGRLEVRDASGQGRKLRTNRKLEYFYPSSESHFALEVLGDEYVVSQVSDDKLTKMFAIEKKTFDCFAPLFRGSLLALPQARGSVLVYSTATKEKEWEYTPANGAHVTRLAYHEMLKSLVGIELDCEGKVGGDKIIKLDCVQKSAECLLVSPCFGTEYGFVKNGTLFVTAANEVFSVPPTDQVPEWM